MKKIIAGIAIIAVMAGCLFAGNVNGTEQVNPVAGDRNGLVIC